MNGEECAAGTGRPAGGAGAGGEGGGEGGGGGVLDVRLTTKQAERRSTVEEVDVEVRKADMSLVVGDSEQSLSIRRDMQAAW
jgi:hypothetical protein